MLFSSLLKSIEDEIPFTVNEWLSSFKLDYTKDNFYHTLTLDALYNDYSNRQQQYKKQWNLLSTNLEFKKKWNQKNLCSTFHAFVKTVWVNDGPFWISPRRVAHRRKIVSHIMLLVVKIDRKWIPFT